MENGKGRIENTGPRRVLENLLRFGKKTWNIARSVSDGGGAVVLRLGKQQQNDFSF